MTNGTSVPLNIKEIEMEDKINHPKHYTWLPNGLEVIDITENLNFCLGNAVKYILRADHKGNPIEDLQKAIWYLNREISRRSK
jgi:hypothetical protein